MSKKEKSILELDRLFKDFGRQVKTENKFISQKIKRLTSSSAKERRSIDRHLSKINQEILCDIEHKRLNQLPNRINFLVAETKRLCPKLHNFLK